MIDCKNVLIDVITVMSDDIGAVSDGQEGIASSFIVWWAQSTDRLSAYVDLKL